jgi:hypothetical protein
VLQQILRINKNIIKVSCIKVVKVVKEKVVHILLVGCGPICQSKGEDLAFVCSIPHIKSSILFRGGIYLDLIKSLADIKLCKDLCAGQAGQNLVN